MMFPVSRTHLLWKMGALVICMTNCIIVVCVIDDLIIYICKKKLCEEKIIAAQRAVIVTVQALMGFILLECVLHAP